MPYVCMCMYMYMYVVCWEEYWNLHVPSLLLLLMCMHVYQFVAHMHVYGNCIGACVSIIHAGNS